MMTPETIEKITQLSAPQTGRDCTEQFITMPATMKVEDVSRFYPPTRAKATPQFTEAAGFIAYVNRFKTAATVMFASISDTGAQLTAIIDYHSPEKPDYGSHRAGFTLERTTDWNNWMGNDRKAMAQLAFAEFLENHQHLIAEPNGAELLELVLTLEGKNDVAWQSVERLKDGGAKLLYDEVVNVTGATKAGTMKLPDQIGAGIQVFQGCPKVPVLARLKYRMAERKISLWYETIMPHVLVRTAVAEVVSAIQETTQITAWPGKP